jgi:hypothetical protein
MNHKSIQRGVLKSKIEGVDCSTQNGETAFVSTVESRVSGGKVMASRSATRIGLCCLLLFSGSAIGCNWNWRSLAIPDKFPLGSVNRAHYHTMEINGEAADFILHWHEFVCKTAELTPDGKDHVL